MSATHSSALTRLKCQARGLPDWIPRFLFRGGFHGHDENEQQAQRCSEQDSKEGDNEKSATEIDWHEIRQENSEEDVGSDHAVVGAQEFHIENSDSEADEDAQASKAGGGEESADQGKPRDAQIPSAKIRAQESLNRDKRRTQTCRDEILATQIRFPDKQDCKTADREQPHAGRARDRGSKKIRATQASSGPHETIHAGAIRRADPRSARSQERTHASGTHMAGGERAYGAFRLHRQRHGPRCA
ncbi:MAG: hypothetical protein WAS23_03075 [Dokdonella sp.]|uniref:hypothetical protein n=1 Tax=Dokdonella sp. TaxID=2291710 RepID=UPI003BB0C3E3